MASRGHLPNNFWQAQHGENVNLLCQSNEAEKDLSFFWEFSKNFPEMKKFQMISFVRPNSIRDLEEEKYNNPVPLPPLAHGRQVPARKPKKKVRNRHFLPFSRLPASWMVFELFQYIGFKGNRSGKREKPFPKSRLLGVNLFSPRGSGHARRKVGDDRGRAPFGGRCSGAPLSPFLRPPGDSHELPTRPVTLRTRLYRLFVGTKKRSRKLDGVRLPSKRRSRSGTVLRHHRWNNKKSYGTTFLINY